jgi:hypothetical protein
MGLRPAQAGSRVRQGLGCPAWLEPCCVFQARRCDIHQAAGIQVREYQVLGGEGKQRPYLGKRKKISTLGTTRTTHQLWPASTLMCHRRSPPARGYAYSEAAPVFLAPAVQQQTGQVVGAQSGKCSCFWGLWTELWGRAELRPSVRDREVQPWSDTRHALGCAGAQHSSHG